MSEPPSPPATPEVALKVVIGIAFGNTTSSIAYTAPVGCHSSLFIRLLIATQDGKAEVIANEEGGALTVSTVAVGRRVEGH